MKKVQCENKHFYDADIYEVCPHCRKGQSGIPNNGLTLSNIHQNTVFCTNCGKSMSITKFFCTNCGVKLQIPEQNDVHPPKKGHTHSIWDSNQGKTGGIFENTEDMPTTPASDNNINALPIVIPSEPKRNPEVSDESTPQSPFHFPQSISKSNPSQDEENTENDLRQAVEDVTSYNTAEDVKTVAFYDFGSNESPIVGWLVCVKGEYQGQGFELKSGQNYIGRAQNMNIALAREASVSRHRHAVITFDPTKNIFYIQQGESSGLTYLNGNLVMAHIQLNEYDKIRLGNAEFVFVSFCNDKFSWNDYMNK